MFFRHRLSEFYRYQSQVYRKLFFRVFTTKMEHSVPQKGAKDVMITNFFSVYTSTSFLLLPSLLLHLLLAQRNLPAVATGERQQPVAFRPSLSAVAALFIAPLPLFLLPLDLLGLFAPSRNRILDLECHYGDRC